jgi:hypothetical protein
MQEGNFLYKSRKKIVLNNHQTIMRKFNSNEVERGIRDGFEWKERERKKKKLFPKWKIHHIF